MIKEHFVLLYTILNATVTTSDGATNYLSHIPVPYYNAVFGTPNNDECIQKQIAYFQKEKMPFVWYLDEGSPAKQKLLDHGFQDAGIFQGVMGPLHDIPASEIDYELVKDESALDEFTDIVCSVFEIEAKADLKRIFSQAKNMCHWLARKDGRAVSTLSTLIDGEMVSFWNGATLPEYRKQGLSTALRHIALRDAISKGCKTGASYLMSEGMALGICTKLGFEPKWRFHVLVFN